MDESEQNMTRYLLGELSESERASLEEKFFADPQVFDQVLKAESELLDNYVRGRLSGDARAQFERSYLADPRRRERVKFAEALVTRIDQMEASKNAAAQKADHASLLQSGQRGQRWQSLLATLRGRRLALSVSIALVVLIAIGGLWSFIESRRVRRELAETQAARANQERRARELEEQRAANERQQAEELTAELNRRQNTQALPAQPSPAPTVRAAATPVTAFVTLHLSIGVTRSADTGPAQTLTIPTGTKEVRLRLDLKENDYASYGVSLRAVGGREIFGRRGLKPVPAKSRARLNLTLPADGLITGDYMLTLSGISQDGSVEDLSKSIFRVEKR
jgi:anti-sigma factor RsiW